MVGLTSSQKHQGGACVARDMQRRGEILCTIVSAGHFRFPTLPASSGLHPPLKRLADLFGAVRNKPKPKKENVSEEAVGRLE